MVTTKRWEKGHQPGGILKGFEKRLHYVTGCAINVLGSTKLTKNVGQYLPNNPNPGHGRGFFMAKINYE